LKATRSAQGVDVERQGGDIILRRPFLTQTRFNLTAQTQQEFAVQDPDAISLTPDESVHAQALVFEIDDLEDRGDFPVNAQRALSLTKALMARKGVPDHRRRYFTDPDFNPGGRGRSRQQVFERNGCVGDAILLHAHFLPHLRYFLQGADLPSPVRAAFRGAVQQMEPITSGDLAPLGKLARKLARDQRLSPHVAQEEFFKLALDCGLSAWQAESVRKAVAA
jgi:hypothetical protein